MHVSPTPGTAVPTSGRGRLALRLATITVASCGVLATGLVAAGGAAAASTTTATTTTAAPAPVTTAAPVRQSAAVSLRATRTKLVKGQRTRITYVVSVGTAHKRLAGATVKIQARSAGQKWHTVGTRRLSATGVLISSPAPGKTISYRLYVPGSATRKEVVSRALTIQVRLSQRQKVVAAAVSRIGSPYVFGAAGPRSFDCSGLTKYAYRQAGVTLPHNADAQKRYGKGVSRKAAKPGDLVVFYSGGYAYHAAIYAGNGYIYEAARPGTRVGKHKIWSNAIGFRRLVA